jgi:hypothetical protein
MPSEKILLVLAKGLGHKVAPNFRKGLDNQGKIKM